MKMGVLYNVVKVREQDNVMGELKNMGIQYARDGRSLDELTYKELVLQLAIAKVVDIDIENDDNNWF